MLLEKGAMRTLCIPRKTHAVELTFTKVVGLYTATLLVVDSTTGDFLGLS